MFSKKNEPIVKEISLKKDYPFMYEGFMITTQHVLYLLLEEHEGLLDVITFPFLIYKFGYPNDEALNAHPMAKYGMGFYGIYEVFNSPWIQEIKEANKNHPRHNDNAYDNYRHIIIRYKDNTIDVLSREMNEIQLTKNDVANIVDEEINSIQKDIS